MACPVCFGDSSEPMALATNMGIWFMLGVVGAMLTAFGSFFIYLLRRGRIAAQSTDSTDGPPPLRPAGDAPPYARGQEGTAQC